MKSRKGHAAITKPSLTSKGSFFPRPLRPNSFRADSLLAVSMYENGMRAFLRMVSMRDVAVIMCEEPAVRDVKRYSAGSSSQL